MKKSNLFNYDLNKKDINFSNNVDFIFDEEDLKRQRDENNKLNNIIKVYKCGCNFKDTLIFDDNFKLICKYCKCKAYYE